MTENENMERLEKILDEFSEAIVICDPWGWISLFNPQAKQLFGNTEALNLGHSLYGICHQTPFEQAFRVLLQNVNNGDRFGKTETEATFVCATIRDTELFNCHIRLIPAETSHESFFILSFHHIAKQVDETTLKGSLLTRMIEDLRAPLANLHAASASLKENPQMELEARLEFENVIAAESSDLIRRYESVVQESRSLTYTHWPLIDIYSTDLVRCVASELSKKEDFTVTITGTPQWLQADSYSMMLALESLARAIKDACQVSAIDIDVKPGEQRVYFDMIWQGEPIPQTIIESWFKRPLPDTINGMTIANVLERHNSDMWCQQHHVAGHAFLRVPALSSRKEWEGEGKAMPARPEFYPPVAEQTSFSSGEMADSPLASLSYVVFDSETTGLSPTDGDNIISLAGIKISKQRILSSESFKSLINPNRPIPASSVDFHGITNDTVRGKPPIKVILPEFKAFAEDAVLVGHNPAFDLEFIKHEEDKTGVKFDNPVLDTLLLSVLVAENETDHSLEGICRRLGIKTSGRHTALGDCQITAQLFLVLIDMLETKGITTLGQAIMASEKAAQARKKQAGA